MPHPRVAVLIGGTSKAHEMTQDNVRMLAEQLIAVIDHRKASLLITASRRTGEENMKILREMLCACPVAGSHDAPESAKNVYFWDNAGDNPYFGLLGHADYIIVTEDSVSMTSEALATGKPVYTASLEGGAKRLDTFHRLLQEQGFTRPFTGVLETWSYTPPADTMRVAQEILKRYKERHK
jgi:mitochondrial fission protein ELM1